MKLTSFFAGNAPRFVTIFALAFAGFFFAPTTHAQLPGVPKLPGSRSTKNTKPSAKDTPTIKQISPTKILPGKPFDLTISGTNLGDGMDLALACHDQMNGHDAAAFTVKPASVKVTDSTTVIAHVEFPAGHSDSHCTISGVGLQMPPGMQVVISEHINDPMLLSGRYIGDGEMEPMQMAMQIGPAMQRTGEKFELLPGSVRYTQNGKALFDRPISDIKTIEPVKVNGSSSGMFKLVFKDGKTYNFIPAGTGEDAMKQIDAAMQGK